ncbi:MAG: sulfotransferase domain-containing protein [Planctomycetota bacterium]
MPLTSPKKILTPSYPKSGATWFRFLTFGIEKGWAMESQSVKKHNPETGHNTHWPESIGQEERSFVKTHLPFWDGNHAAAEADGIILLVRNPFDCMMSRLSHNRLHGVDISEPEKIRNFFAAFTANANKKQREIREDRMDGGWSNHQASWRGAEAMKERISFIRFEDLSQDCAGTLQKVNVDLNLGWQPLDIQRGVLFGSKQWMSALEAHEVEHEVLGMFYSRKRAEAFASHGARFVGGVRKVEDYEIFMEHVQEAFLEEFTAPCEELGYDLESIIQAKYATAKAKAGV